MLFGAAAGDRASWLFVLKSSNTRNYYAQCALRFRDPYSSPDVIIVVIFFKIHLRFLRAHVSPLCLRRMALVLEYFVSKLLRLESHSAPEETLV